MTTQVHIRNMNSEGGKQIHVSVLDPATNEPTPGNPGAYVDGGGEHACYVHGGAMLRISEVQPESK